MRLLLCDDHLMVVESFAIALGDHGHEVLPLTTTPAEAIAAAREMAYDVGLIDASFPTGSGLDVAAEVLAVRPQVKLIILSATVEPNLVRAALHAGFVGFVRKDERFGAVLRALERVVAGEIAIEPGLLRAALQVKEPSRSARTELSLLTFREREALKRVALGESNREIAHGMGISSSTARTHVQNALMKIGVKSRLQAAALLAGKDMLSELR